MNSRPGPIDVEHIIGEVARRHGIVLHPNDAAFAQVTINELVLKSTVREAMKTMAATLDRFDASIERAENRAGQILGQQVRESAQELLKAVHAEIVEGIKAHSKVALRLWTGITVLCVALLCAGAFWLGRLMAPR